MQAAVIGHNNPPSDIDIINERLNQSEADIRNLMAFGDAPDAIADEQEAGRITQTIKNAKAVIAKVTDTHKTLKEPYLECGKACDAWKRRLEAEITDIVKKFSAPLNAFLEAKAKEERERQLAAARAEQAKAEALQREAVAHENAGIQDTANELMDAAVHSEFVADQIVSNVIHATPSQLAKSRSFEGATASQKLVWTGEINNLAAMNLNALRDHFKLEDIQKAVNSFVRNGGRELDGVVIKQVAQLSVR